jgi:hypothetical protein
MRERVLKIAGSRLGIDLGGEGCLRKPMPIWGSCATGASDNNLLKYKFIYFVTIIIKLSISDTLWTLKMESRRVRKEKPCKHILELLVSEAWIHDATTNMCLMC